MTFEKLMADSGLDEKTENSTQWEFYKFIYDSAIDENKDRIGKLEREAAINRGRICELELEVKRLNRSLRT